MPEQFWKHRTNRGRVVYDRKPRGFTCADYVRISQKMAKKALAEPFFAEKEALLDCLAMGAVDVLWTFLLDESLEDELVDRIHNRIYTLIEFAQGKWPGFGGGEFGGAGVTRRIP